MKPTNTYTSDHTQSQGRTILPALRLPVCFCFYSQMTRIQSRHAKVSMNSNEPIPINVYVNKSSFIEGFRAIPTTKAAKS